VIDRERVREVRERLRREGPQWTRSDTDFRTVTLPEHDCDLLRDLLVAERAATVVEIGLAYGSSALAIGEALVTVGAARHVIVDPFQESAFADVGWNLLREAGLDAVAELVREWSSIALPRLVSDGFVADAAFVDGSHRFHEVFVDLYFLRKLVRPGGLVVLDDNWAPSVFTAARYFERNLGWERVPGAFAGGSTRRAGSAADSGVDLVPRCVAYRLPALSEPAFTDFRPF
jgi:predicted O-methyltransferase YrrM